MAKDMQFRGAISALANSKKASRTALFQWLRRHHAEIAATIAAERVHWPTFAKALADRGMMDRKGQPVLPPTVKTTWYRVCADVAVRPKPVQAKRHLGDPADVHSIPESAAVPPKLGAAPIKGATTTRMASGDQKGSIDNAIEFGK